MQIESKRPPQPVFIAVVQTKYGNTIYTDNPKADALKQMAFYQVVMRINTQTTQHADGTVTVQADTLSPITFAPVRS